MALDATFAQATTAQERGLPAKLSLGTIYSHAVRDTNGDGLADQIVARVIVPNDASLEDVQAAANISARLGYETTAASLPVALKDGETGSLRSVELAILIGRGNRFVQEFAADGRIDLRSLQPGQGLVALVSRGLGGQPSVVVAGSDDAGTLAASVELAARLPRIWNMTGVKVDAVEASAVAYLREHGVTDVRAAVTSVVLDSARRGLSEVDLEVNVPADKAQEASRAFAALEADHRVGRGLDTLDFAAVTATKVKIVTPSGTVEHVVIHRTGASWRTVTSLPPGQPPLAREALLAEASGTAAPKPGRAPVRCLGCPAFRVDGMFPGGGGGNYSPSAPSSPAPTKAFDLSSVYSIDGWFGDRYRDLIPDATETSIILGGNADEALGSAEIAARLGLETTGITLPIARRDTEIAQAAYEPNPILVGRENLLVQALVSAGRIRFDGLGRGEGAIEIVPRAFGNATATVVAGLDQEGANAASLYLARRLPYVWEVRPGAVSLQDLKAQVSDFFALRTGAGQAAEAVNELSAILAEAGLRGPLDDVSLKLYLDQPDPALAPYLKRLIERQGRGQGPAVEVLAARTPVQMFSDRVQAPWEGDAFWSKFRNDALPQVARGDTVEVEVRLSENPQERAQIAREVQAQLEKAGAGRARVDIRSAYKQGFFWLTEDVLPVLRSMRVKAVRIRARTEKPDYSKPRPLYEHPARWAKELYPADQIFKRDLGLPEESFAIEQVDDQASVYTLEATDGAGKIVYTSSFDPVIVERSFVQSLSGSARHKVETGSLSVRVNGKTVIESGIETDLERIWDTYERAVLPKLRDYLKQAGQAPAGGAAAPVFRDLRIDAFMSEPDYEFGVEGEHISSLEGLGEDLIMATNAYLRAAGVPTPARVIPIILPKAGRASAMNVTLSASAAPAARIELSYRVRGDKQSVHVVRDLKPLGLENAQATRIVVRADQVREIRVGLTASNVAAATEAMKAINALKQLQQAGIFRGELSYAHVDTLAISITTPQDERNATVPNTGFSAEGDVRRSDRRSVGELVQWDHVINSAESESIITALSHYPSVAAYRKAKSYEGRDISVMEITEPSAGDLTSVAKIGAYKPTALFIGRQHGSEPSSTSFILRLAERLATDPSYHDIVRNVNVVMLPIMNPDGAELAGEIRKLRPLDIASPGYLSALGQDLTVSTTMPESVVDPYLWRRWLPDIYLNAHGASSHEVVHPFDGYVSPQAPTYSFRRGWYLLSFRLPDDPRYEERTRAGLAMRDAIAREINADPRARAGNLEDYARFERWGYGFSPHLEPMEVYKNVMLFYSDQDSGELLGINRLPYPPAETPESNRSPWVGDWPLLTMDAGTIEAADEGARGDLLDLAARNGFAASLALLKYLRDGTHDLKRIEEDAPGDGATLTTLRLRPVMPPRGSSR